MVSFTSIIIAAVASTALVISATAADCKHKIQLDFSKCPNSDPSAYQARFLSDAKVKKHSGEWEKVDVKANGNEICIKRNNIAGHVYLDVFPSNVVGDNIDNVRVKFTDASARVSYWRKGVHELTLDRSAATPAKVHITDSTGKIVSPKLVFPAFNEHIEKDGNNLGAKIRYCH